MLKVPKYQISCWCLFN